MRKRERKTTTSIIPIRQCLGDLVQNLHPRVQGDTRLTTAWNVFLDHALQSVTVVDLADRPIGILWRADLAEAVLDDAPTMPGLLLGPLGRDRGERWRGPASVVQDIMKPLASTLPASATLEDAAAALEAAEVSEMVVVDEAGRMLGVVEADDLVPYLAARRPLARRWTVTIRPALRR